MQTNQKSEKFPHAVIALGVAALGVLLVAPAALAALRVFSTLAAALGGH